MKRLALFLLLVPFVSGSGGCNPAGEQASSLGIAHLNLWILVILGTLFVAWSFLAKATRKKRNWKKTFLIIGLLLLLWSAYRFYDESLYDTHLHANFKVVLDGKELDFAKPEFMTESKTDHSKKVHLHDLNGGVVHVHYPHITWADFFDSVGMKLEDDCLDAAKSGKACNLTFILNGTKVANLGDIEIQDLDRVLITNNEDIADEWNSVQHDACISSNKCPELGSPKGMESQGSCSG